MLFDAAKLTERLEETKKGLLEVYPWATIKDSRIIFEGGVFVTQGGLAQPDLKWSIDWDSRTPRFTTVAKEDHEVWLALTEGEFMGVV